MNVSGRIGGTVRFPAASAGARPASTWPGRFRTEVSTCGLGAPRSARTRGRLGGETIGKDIALEFVGAELSGRFGGHFAGKDVSLHFDTPPEIFDTPPEIALLAAVIGFKALEDNSSRAAAASS